MSPHTPKLSYSEILAHIPRQSEKDTKHYSETRLSQKPKSMRYSTHDDSLPVKNILF